MTRPERPARRAPASDEGRRTAAIRGALVAWFEKNARDLPWRRTTDPYAIWVSEIMLQQTRVETVRRYYDRFLARFPTARALADASEDDVLSMWSGLGYYRRARLLQRGARDVVASYGGEVPREREARLGISGIGAYTAGAIGSIAFGLEEPLVDGNVARVLSRIDALDAQLGSKESERALWRRAEELVRGPSPSRLNQSLMELGATVCTPTSPRCGECPVAAHCVALRDDRVSELPRAKPKRPPIAMDLVAVVVRDRDGRVLLERRDEGELFRGLHGVIVEEGSSLDVAHAALARRGLELALTDRGQVVHQLTHRTFTVRVFAGTAPRTSVGFHDDASLASVGISTFTRKILVQAARTTENEEGPRHESPPSRASRASSGRRRSR